MSIINLRVTHKKATIPILEAVRLKDYALAESVQEMVVIQTCNRVEIYAVVGDDKREKARYDLTQGWKKIVKMQPFSGAERIFEDYLDVEYDSDAVRHLFRLTAGLESMIVGEDQILGQVKNAFIEAKLSKNVGPILSIIFDRAIKLGARVRAESRINKGAVSIGSVTVNIAEKILGDLKDRSSLLIGAGEVGLLVAKALLTRKQKTIFVTSRSFERAKALTDVVGGEPLNFQDALKKIGQVDLIVLATTAPYYLIKQEDVERAFQKRNGKFLLIFDLSTPRNVEQSVADLPNAKLLTIDSLRAELDRNLSARMSEVKHIEDVIESELKRAFAILKREGVEPVIASFYQRAETIRLKELNKAIQMLGDADPKVIQIINDLSVAIVDGVLNEPVLNLRRVAEESDIETIELTKRLFKKE